MPWTLAIEKRTVRCELRKLWPKQDESVLVLFQTEIGKKVDSIVHEFLKQRVFDVENFRVSF